MAIKDFQKAIEIDREYVQAYFYIGVSKLKSGLVQEAINDFLEAQRLNDAIPGILDGLGQCYHVLGNTDEALEYYLNAITKEPNNVEFLKNRSQCYFDLKMYEESAQDLDKALAQNQCDAQVLYKLGLTYYAH